MLNRPRPAARGILSGKDIGSLKHDVPSSDTTGRTTYADHPTGRDPTDSSGITYQRNEGWGAWCVGLAVDIATDPLSYPTFGTKHALIGVGKAVQKSGALKGWNGRAMLEGFHRAGPGRSHLKS